MQTRRYSSVLAVYHRVGGGRAIPVTGTRHAGSGMALGVSGRVADMPPPTAGYRPPDTGFPGRAESGADFSGVLAALRVRARRADGPKLSESVQPPLQGAIQGGFTGTHTTTRTATHIATHTGAGTGERCWARPIRAMRGAGTPPPDGTAGVCHGPGQPKTAPGARWSGF